MECDVVSTGLAELLHKELWVLHHQMDIENQVGMWPHILHKLCAECHIRYKMTVHNIQVHPLCSVLLHKIQGLSHLAEI